MIASSAESTRSKPFCAVMRVTIAMSGVSSLTALSPSSASSARLFSRLPSGIAAL